MKILEWIKGVKVGTDGYELEEFEKVDGGAVAEKVAQAIIWTGPESTAGTVRTLDGGEKFSNWNRVEVNFNLESDTTSFNRVPYEFKIYNTSDSSYKVYGPTGNMVFQVLSDTSFRISSKTLSAGNVIEILGINI